MVGDQLGRTVALYASERLAGVRFCLPGESVGRRVRSYRHGVVPRLGDVIRTVLWQAGSQGCPGWTLSDGRSGLQSDQRQLWLR